MGQRQRQRERRHRERSPEKPIDWVKLRGDAASILEKLRGSGAATELFARWTEQTSRSDLVTLRKAIHEGWLVPESTRGALAAAVMAKLDAGDTDDRMAIALARTFVAMEEANVEAERAAVEASRRTQA
jgi:hypothetical protein